MIVILVHWHIKKGFESIFVEKWKKHFSFAEGRGPIREILTSPASNMIDDVYHTFSIESPYFSSFINIGFWNSIEEFDDLVRANFVPYAKVDDGKTVIEIEEFEFKIRERIVLDIVSERGGNLPVLIPFK